MLTPKSVPEIIVIDDDGDEVLADPSLRSSAACGRERDGGWSSATLADAQDDEDSDDFETPEPSRRLKPLNLRLLLAKPAKHTPLSPGEIETREASERMRAWLRTACAHEWLYAKTTKAEQQATVRRRRLTVTTAPTDNGHGHDSDDIAPGPTANRTPANEPSHDVSSQRPGLLASGTWLQTSTQPTSSSLTSMTLVCVIAWRPVASTHARTAPLDCVAPRPIALPEAAAETALVNSNTCNHGRCRHRRSDARHHQVHR
jgi:hypothetical protein